MSSVCTTDCPKMISKYHSIIVTDTSLTPRSLMWLFDLFGNYLTVPEGGILFKKYIILRFNCLNLSFSDELLRYM